MSDTGLRRFLILSKLPEESGSKKITTIQLWRYLQSIYQWAESERSNKIRVIQNDIAKLSLDFPIKMIEGEGRGNREGIGWAFEKGGKPSFSLMEPVTALTVLMALDYLRGVFPEHLFPELKEYAAQAKKVLDGLNAKGFSQWPQKVRALPRGYQLQMAVPPLNVKNLIYEALLTNKQFTAIYKNKPDRQRIHPLGLVHRGSVIYLVCRFFDYENIVMTALHRFKDVQLLDDFITPIYNFSLDAYIDQQPFAWLMDEHKPATLEVLFTNDAASHLYETPINDTQKIKPTNKDGWVKITAKVIDTGELRWWLLGFGDQVEVIKPKSMREWFKLVARNMGNIYK